MNYTEITDTYEKYYTVDLDKERLREILEELKKYNFVAHDEGLVGGDIITRWPTTKKNIKERIEKYSFTKEQEGNVNIDTIFFDKEKGNATFKYSYNKLPDLYDYIDILVNNKNVMDYRRLFGNINGKDGMFTIVFHKYQILLDCILNYSNSKEFNLLKDKEGFDYQGLNKLYIETLKCIYFNLIAVKEYIDNPTKVNALELKK